ncbi:MAG: hypothetical protein PUC90_02980 [Prevotella sp.]|nr:hypothetical protein [Prevotella sp.]
MNNTTIKILRWLGVLPAAILAPVVGCTLFMIFTLIGDLFSGDLANYVNSPELFTAEHFFVSFINFAIFGSLFVYAGYMMAPVYKKVVAYILCGIITLIAASLLIVILITIDLATSWRFVINLIICILSATITTLNIKNYE